MCITIICTGSQFNVWKLWDVAPIYLECYEAEHGSSRNSFHHRFSLRWCVINCDGSATVQEINFNGPYKRFIEVHFNFHGLVCHIERYLQYIFVTNQKGTNKAYQQRIFLWCSLILWSISSTLFTWEYPGKRAKSIIFKSSIRFEKRCRITKNIIFC